MAIPTHHVPGDTGHTTDHNEIVDVLTNHAGRITGVEGVQGNYLLKAGGNTIALANPAGVAETVTIPAGTRSTGIYVKQVTYGGVRVFALDTYGQARLGAASDSEVPLRVHGRSVSHSGDLQQWRRSEAGANVARVAFDGTLYAPNITPGAWTNITLASGYIWHSDLGARPQYRIVGDVVELRGNIERTGGGDFPYPAELGTLPVAPRPPYPIYHSCASSLNDDEAYVRVEVRVNGSIHAYFRSGYNPVWISLDPIRYSLTP